MSRLTQEWERQWEEARDVAAEMIGHGQRMLRLATELRTAPDGYPARSMGDGTSPTADTTTSTERAALSDYPDDDPDKEQNHPGPDDRVTRLDRVDHWLSEFFEAETKARANLAQMERLVRLVDKRHDVRVGERSAGAGVCRACLKDVPGTSSDRLRSGFCHTENSCYNAWRTWRDRAVVEDGHPVEWFIAERRLALRIDEEGNELKGREREEAETWAAQGWTGRQLVAEHRRREEEREARRQRAS